MDPRFTWSKVHESTGRNPEAVTPWGIYLIFIRSGQKETERRPADFPHKIWFLFNAEYIFSIRIKIPGISVWIADDGEYLA